MHRYRTHTCSALRAGDAGATVRLSGWLHNRRNLGGVLFVDLRDHYGITQLVARPDSAAFESLSHMPKESVLQVDGRADLRREDNVNPELPTGEVEVEVERMEELGECGPLPFSVFPEEPVFGGPSAAFPLPRSPAPTDAR